MTMSVLKGILSDSHGYYLNLKQKINRKLDELPRGSIKEREISGHKYYYLQQRLRNKIVHKYLGKSRPEDFIKKIQMRKSLKAELKKVNEALRVLNRSKGRNGA
jgi:hypothetical protein